jgi:hypothetical protein
MGLFGGSGKGGRDFNWGNALLAAFGGDAALQALERRRQREAGEAAARAARDEEGGRQEALSLITGPNGQPLFTKSMIAAMTGADASQRVRDELQSRQFSATGGSVESIDPVTGAVTYRQAPWREQVGRALVGQQPGGPVQTLHEGWEPVSVAPGGGAYGVNSSGDVRTLIAPYGAPPMSQTQPQETPPRSPVTGGPSPGTVPNEAQLRAWAREAINQGRDPAQVNQMLEQMLMRGGAGPSGPRNFR